MRIDEIKLPMWRQDAEQRLLSAGYEELGTGSYASVFQKPGRDYVLKVFDTSDDAYLAFLALAKTHPSPHFPKFAGKLVRINEDYAAIRMERLEELASDQIALLEALSRYLYAHTKAGRHLLKPDSHGYRMTMRAVQEIEQIPSLKQACELLTKHLGQFKMDIKVGNLMTRTGTLVFVDPVAIVLQRGEY